MGDEEEVNEGCSDGEEDEEKDEVVLSHFFSMVVWKAWLSVSDNATTVGDAGDTMSGTLSLRCSLLILSWNSIAKDLAQIDKTIIIQSVKRQRRERMREE